MSSKKHKPKPTLGPDSRKTPPTTPILDDERPSGPIFPIEIISKIITCLQHDRKYATLASMALANSTFYDLVIPKLYETITVTKTNMLKLKYGHDARVMGHFPRPPHRQGLCTDDADCPSSIETYRSHFGKEQPRKDKAVGHCLRLIIDVPIFMVETIENVVGRLPCQPYGRVEEIVFTRQGISRQGISYGQPWSLDTVLPPFELPVNRVRRMDPRLLRPRRVVIYAPMDRGLSCSILGLHRHQRIRQLSLQGGQLDVGVTPDLSLAYTTVDIHLVQDPKKSIQSIGSELAAWLVHGHYPDDVGDIQYQLFDIPSLIIKEEYRPKSREDANRLSHDILSGHVKERRGLQRVLQGAPEVTKAIMDRIEFKDSEDGEEEYPVLKPRPVPKPSVSLLEADDQGDHDETEEEESS